MMALRNIQLSASDSNWRLFMVRKADTAFLAFQAKVHERDNYTCQYCGFRAKRYMEIVNLDGNYRNNRLTNLATACGFCSQCFFLDAVGKGESGGGTLIYLPEMTQGELNALCHVLFTSIATESSSATEARNIYRSFKLRSQIIEQQLGEGLSHPALLGQLLVDTKTEKMSLLKDALETKLRLLPDLARFSVQVEAWARDGLEELGSVYNTRD
ncbi:type IVB secretion system protein IcmJDotN [Coxiella burnetii]|uniref:IcmJ n=2 Tax=Coxiella burnetii TaxID=777 RepID=Q83B90_COXBU|nr:type IVB secretion system protein IcmJDotN [Coxiella burnetii]NP_820605.1 Icm secretion system protein IcmJ [Coxiella burnetii RSA 493]AAO91119.1 IcmJ [Coxiella burnetii RSA 493]ABS78475.2 IcmJ [Coxiella burnetii Dugway 5J108-111]ACJ20963.1 IcmJ [Coxiella burnetii CbuK_Q154]ARI66379.1 HNH endonuclease [Coxiella burnetii]AZV75099.1 HNH endonuclease [Coxiella burnetii]